MHDTRSGINLAVAIPWILTLVTALVGIWQFTVQQGQANRQPFLQKQLDLAFLASETTIKLATLTDPADWENPKVESAMVALGHLSFLRNPRQVKVT
jgi:hypothetical protein